jgi:hypothetical protein
MKITLICWALLVASAIFGFNVYYRHESIESSLLSLVGTTIGMIVAWRFLRALSGRLNHLGFVMENTTPSGFLGHAAPKKAKLNFWVKLLILLFILAVFSVIAIGPISVGPRQSPESAAMRTTSTITLAMFQFSNDHGGSYPTGISSTEVFQQLIDGNYVTDPALFYVPMPGKTKSTSSKLKPENVSYDVTSPVNSQSPDGLPLVFLTGYRINYQPNGSAVRLSASSSPFPSLGVCYKANDAIFKIPNPTTSSDTIQNFLPPAFDAKGQKYQQLTPAGPLPAQPDIH